MAHRMITASLKTLLRSLKFWMERYPDATAPNFSHDIEKMENSVMRTAREKEIAYFENLCLVESINNQGVSVPDMVYRCRRAMIAKQIRFSDDVVAPDTKELSTDITLSDNNLYTNFLIPTKFLSVRDRHSWYCCHILHF